MTGDNGRPLALRPSQPTIASTSSMSVPTTTALQPFSHHTTHYSSAAMHRRNSASASPEHQPRGTTTHNTQMGSFPPAQQHQRYEQYRRDESEYGRPIQQHPGSFGGHQRIQPPMHGRVTGQQPSVPGYHVQQSPPQQIPTGATRAQYLYLHHQHPQPQHPQPQQPQQQQQLHQQQLQVVRTAAAPTASKPASHHPAATHSSSSSSGSHLHRPYDLHSPAPASRTFWNHYETSLLVQLWLEFEPQFMANKRNAGVWAQLAERLTERSGRHRTVRECRIKWKNMWAKHRDLANAAHMSWDAKLREFPHFSEFVEIKQRSSMQPSNDHAGSEGKQSPPEEDHRASVATHSLAGPALRDENRQQQPLPTHLPASIADPRQPHYHAPYQTGRPIYAMESASDQRSTVSPLVAEGGRMHSGGQSLEQSSDHQSMSPGRQYRAKVISSTMGAHMKGMEGGPPGHLHSQMRSIPPLALAPAHQAVPSQMKPPMQPPTPQQLQSEHDAERRSSLASILVDNPGPYQHVPRPTSTTPTRPIHRQQHSGIHHLLAPEVRGNADDNMPQRRQRVEYRDTAATSIPGQAAPAVTAAAAAGQPSLANISHSVSDIPELMRQFDYEPRDPSDPLYVRSERQHIDSLVERMRNMTSLASPSEMSGVAQQILSYVETESRRRQMQSERHDRIVSTLAEIIASTPASTPITNTASRRSSVMQEWVQQPVAGSRRGSETQQLVLMPAVRSNLPPASSSAVEEAHGAVADTVFVQPRFHTTASRSESLPTISPIMSSRASPAASDAQTANQPASRASN